MRYEEIDPIKDVALSLPDFEFFLAFNLRDELFAKRVQPDSVDRIMGKQGDDWEILMRIIYQPLGQVHPQKTGKRTLTIICMRAGGINTTPEAERAAREYWARPDAELQKLPHPASSYDDAYMMRRWLIDDLRRVSALPETEQPAERSAATSSLKVNTLNVYMPGSQTVNQSGRVNINSGEDTTVDGDVTGKDNIK